MIIAAETGTIHIETAFAVFDVAPAGLAPEMPNTPDNGYTGCMQYNHQASTIQLA